MTNERDDQQSSQPTESKQSQDPTGQQSASQQPSGEQQHGEPTSQSESTSPTASDSGGQSATGQSAEDTDTLTSQETGQESGQTTDQETGQAKGEGFVGSESTDSSEYLQEKGQSESDIEGSTGKPPLDGE